MHSSWCKKAITVASPQLVNNIQHYKATYYVKKLKLKCIYQPTQGKPFPLLWLLCLMACGLKLTLLQLVLHALKHIPDGSSLKDMICGVVDNLICLFEDLSVCFQ